MTTKYIGTRPEEVKKELMGFLDSGNVYIENSNGNVESFTYFIQIFSDKTATALNSTSLATFSVYSIIPDVSVR